MKSIIDSTLKEYMQMIYVYLVKNGVNKSDAEDIVQETLYKAVLYIDSISPSNFRSWAFKVAINLYRDLCRKQNRYSYVNFGTVSLTDDSTPESTVLEKEKHEGITTALTSLKPIYKKALYLKYYLGMPYKEIAKYLNLSEEMTKTYLYRGRKQLLKQLRRLNDD